MPEQPDISPTAEHLLLPLELLFDELKNAGFARDRVGVPFLMRLDRLRQFLDDDTTLEQLKFKLSALICQSAEEQVAFGAVFASFLERFRALEAEAPGANENTGADKESEGSIETPETPPSSKQQPNVIPPPKPGNYKSNPIKAKLSGPITVELHFRSDGYRPWNLPELESVVRPLREKEFTGAEEWDIPSTIQRSIRAGGAPCFVRRRRRKAPQYLFLIQQKSARDHLAGFYADMVLELSRRDLDAEYYFYDRIPDQCWKDRRDPASFTTIGRLNAAYQLSRLIIIGEPDVFLALTQEKDAKTEKLNTQIHLYPSSFAFQLRDSWSSVALLNTRSTALWGDTEQALHQLFPIAPANIAGLGSLLTQWTNRLSLQPYFWKLQNPEPIPPNLHFLNDASETVKQVIKNLKLYLGRQGYTWLCAIAVYPELYWQLSKMLHDEAISAIDVPDESQRIQLWHLFLLRLSRLEWLRRGYIPPEYRQELRKDLPTANAADVRRQLLEVLQLDENQAPPDSYAAKDLAYTKVLFEHEHAVFRDNPDDIRKVAMQEKLRQDVDEIGVSASDIEDAVGRSIFRELPELPVQTLKHYWVLWVDDKPKNNTSFQLEIAKETAIQFVNVTNTPDVITALKGQTFDLIISDVSRFGDREAGIKMMRRLNELQIATPTLFFTHPNYVALQRKALLNLGASDVVTSFKQLKPFLVRLIKRKEKDNAGELAKVKLLEDALIVSKAVCRVVAYDSMLGTGFLIAGGYLITNNHVIRTPEEAKSAKIQFSYEIDPQGKALQLVEYELDPSDMILSPPDKLDFSRIKVVDRSDAPLSQWGQIDMLTSPIPSTGELLSVIHHPKGERKRTALSEYQVIHQEAQYLYVAYTPEIQPGSSGGPILNADLKAVAMVHAGKNKIIAEKDVKVKEFVLMRDIVAFIQEENNREQNPVETDADLIKEADALFLQGREAYEKKEYKEAEDHLYEALLSYVQAQNREGRAKVQQQLGNVYRDTGRLLEAKQAFGQAENIFFELNFQGSRGYALMDLAKVELRLVEYDVAEVHIGRALEIFEGLDDDLDVAIVQLLMDLGYISEAKGDLDEAKKRTLTALKRARKSELKILELVALQKLGEINLSLGDSNQAEGCFGDAVEVSRAIKNRPAEAYALERLAEALRRSGDVNLAIERLTEAQNIYVAFDDKEGESRVEKLLQAWNQEKIQVKEHSSPNPRPDLPYPTSPIRTFLAYAHQDLPMVEEMRKFLRPIERGGLLQIWAEFDIQAGANWNQEISSRLAEAELVLLCISPASLSSDFYYEKDLVRSFERHDIGTTRIIPIILRPCLWKEVYNLKHRAVLPENGQPISSFSDRDGALLEVAEGIKRVAIDILRKRTADKDHQEKELLEKERLADEAAWKKAKALNSIKGYENYIAIGPTASYTAAALELIEKIKRSEEEQLARQSEHKKAELERRALEDAEERAILKENRRRASEKEARKVAETLKTNDLDKVDLRNTKQKIKEFIANGYLKQPLELLQIEMHNRGEVWVLLSQVEQLESAKRNGTLSYDQILLFENKLRASILDLANQLSEASDATSPQPSTFKRITDFLGITTPQKKTKK